jgi:hypothetical protein
VQQARRPPSSYSPLWELQILQEAKLFIYTYVVLFFFLKCFHIMWVISVVINLLVIRRSKLLQPSYVLICINTDFMKFFSGEACPKYWESLLVGRRMYHGRLLSKQAA